MRGDFHKKRTENLVGDFEKTEISGTKILYGERS